MKITKFGHSCLLVEEAGVRILIDPGTLAQGQNELDHISALFVTHEHADHLDPNSVKAIAVRNPALRIFASPGAAAVLEKEHIERSLFEEGSAVSVGPVPVEGFGRQHALLHTALPQIQNTGVFIANRLWYPGDSFTDPKRTVDILALPVAGPWMKFSEAVDYALALKPRRYIPVHDGILVSSGFITANMNAILEPQGIQCVTLQNGVETEF